VGIVVVLERHTRRRDASDERRQRRDRATKPGAANYWRGELPTHRSNGRTNPSETLHTPCRRSPARRGGRLSLPVTLVSQMNVTVAAQRLHPETVAQGPFMIPSWRRRA